MRDFLWDLRLYRGEDREDDAIVSYRKFQKDTANFYVYSMQRRMRGTRANDLSFMAGAAQVLRLITGTSWRVEYDNKSYACIIAREESPKTRKYCVECNLRFLFDIDVDSYGSLVLYFTNDISNGAEPLVIHLNHNLKTVFKNKTPEKLPRAWIVRGAVWAVNWYMLDVLNFGIEFHLPANSNWRGFP